MKAAESGSLLRPSALAEPEFEFGTVVPYFSRDEQLEVLLKGKRSEIKHAIECSITAAKLAGASQKKRIEFALKNLGNHSKPSSALMKMIQRLKELEQFGRVWQHSYREAFLRDEDNMEELSVEDFYNILEAAQTKPLKTSS